MPSILIADDHPLFRAALHRVATDAVADLEISEADDFDGVMEAIEHVGAGGALVLMDLGSAVLSAETALDLLPDETRERVMLCEAPVVEGAVAAAAGPAPPPPITPMNANWLPPVNISRLSTHVCQRVSPLATERAPKEMP